MSIPYDLLLKTLNKNSLKYVPTINTKDIFDEKYTGKNKSNIIKQQKLIEATDKLDAVIQYAICKMKYDRKVNDKMRYYYEIIKSWWNVFPDRKVRIKGKATFFKYKTYKDAHEAAVEIRKKDPNYRYDLGDRIYVRRCKNV